MLTALFKKQDSQKIFTSQSNGIINIRPDTDLAKQIKMLDLTEQDLRIMKELSPYVHEYVHQFVDDFYANLKTKTKLIKIINDHSSIERLKRTLRQHISEMFSGVIDEHYIKNRIRIAHAHVRIGLDTKWYICSFQNLMNNCLFLVKKHIKDTDEIILAVSALTKLFNLEQQLVIEAYDAEIQRREQEQQDIEMKLKQTIQDATQNLASISEETNASFHELIQKASEIAHHAKKGNELSNETTEKADEGASQLNRQMQNIQNIETAVNTITCDIKGLLDVLNKMQHVIDIIKNVANDTNLLSLNASIQAAHAGDAGRGFSVVAQEIRGLADRTKESVGTVSKLIENINKQVEKVTNTLNDIGRAVQIGNKGMDKTYTRFKHIHDLMKQTQIQNEHITEELQAFANMIDELGQAFDEVTHEADRLANISYGD